jgi:hypothetical protein
MTMEQAIHLNAVADPQAAKAKLVIDALAGDRDLTPAELGLLDEVARVPGVQAARDARFARQHAARVALAQEQERQREADRVERVTFRRSKWNAAHPALRAGHVVGEEIATGKLKPTFPGVLIRFGELIADPRETLLTRRRRDGLGWAERTERAPPVTFEPSGYEHDDPVAE